MYILIYCSQDGVYCTLSFICLYRTVVDTNEGHRIRFFIFSFINYNWHIGGSDVIVVYAFTGSLEHR